MTAVAPTLQAFFTDRLVAQRHARPHTIAAYRDPCACCCVFAAGPRSHDQHARIQGHRRGPDRARSCDHLERERGNSARTRNARLAAIRSLFRIRRAARTPSTPTDISRVLAIPAKRSDQARGRRFLDRDEVDALLRRPTATRHRPP